MHVTKKQVDKTKVVLTISSNPGELANFKKNAVDKLAKNIKVAGFRAGKAPLNLVERQLAPQSLQTEFLDTAVNQLYVDAVTEVAIRPIAPPEISVTKFVPFETLEFTTTVEVVGDIVLPDYTTIKMKRPTVSVTDKDVAEVIERLRLREAEKKEVTRASKDGDEVWIDFEGRDNKTKEPINGASGKDYPLILGSNSFIPGFEPELVGLKPSATKTFTITFPKDYGVAALQSRVVEFTVTVHKVQEVVQPPVNNSFAEKIGPFKTVAELEADIKKQLLADAEAKQQQAFETELVIKITEQTEIAVPPRLIDEQLELMEQEERQNLLYRGQTWQEHLQEEGISEEAHRERQREPATQRVKTGLVLSEISQKEDITVTPEELEIRIQILKGQYQDKQMQIELDKPENRRDIMNRILTEKTLKKLVDYTAHN